MAATVNAYVVKGGCLTYDGKVPAGFKTKLNVIGCQYHSLETFKNASISELNGLKTKDGYPSIKALSPKEEEAIKKLQKEIDTSKSIQENFVKVLTKGFIAKQLALIDKIEVKDFNANPILCHVLKLT